MVLRSTQAVVYCCNIQLLGFHAKTDRVEFISRSQGVVLSRSPPTQSNVQSTGEHGMCTVLPVKKKQNGNQDNDAKFFSQKQTFVPWTVALFCSQILLRPNRYCCDQKSVIDQENWHFHKPYWLIRSCAWWISRSSLLYSCQHCTVLFLFRFEGASRVGRQPQQVCADVQVEAAAH